MKSPRQVDSCHTGGRTDVIVIGAGVAGLVLGIALAREGVGVTVVGRAGPLAPGRTVALLDGSIALLDRLGLWQTLAADAAPLRAMRIVDDTGSLFRIPPVTFRAEEIGRERFGANVANDLLIDRLRTAARATLGKGLVDAHAVSARFTEDGAVVSLDEGDPVAAPLVVACDGRKSVVRAAAGIAVRSRSYPQNALTATLSHREPHGGLSTEFHTRAGPFTLVPLPGTAGAPHRSSLVWVMDPAEAERRRASPVDRLAREIATRARGLLGPVRVEGSVGCFPLSTVLADRLTGPRLALAGEAAHALPPIGAQGLNLGLRDVAALAAILSGARRRGIDLGSPQVLREYEHDRRGDIATRAAAIDWLNRSLLTPLLPVDLLRGAGLLALGRFGALRRAVMRQGLMPAA